MSENRFRARDRRAGRVRARLTGRSDYLRLTVFRSNKYIYAQVIDDKKGQTLAAASDLKNTAQDKANKTKRASQVGRELGQKLLTLKIKQVVFDRGAYIYGGRVKALADSVRATGIII